MSKLQLTNDKRECLMTRTILLYYSRKVEINNFFFTACTCKIYSSGNIQVYKHNKCTRVALITWTLPSLINNRTNV